MDTLRDLAPAGALVLYLPLAAQAHVTAPLEVTVTVAAVCDVIAAPLDFGVYDGAPVNASADIEVTCNDGVAYQIGLDAGLHSDGANRFLSDGNGHMIPYVLVDPATGQPWGDAGVGDTFPAPPVSATGTGAPQVFTVDGMIDAAAGPVHSGAYADTVTVTINF